MAQGCALSAQDGRNKKPSATVRADAEGLDRTSEESPLVRAVIGGTPKSRKHLGKCGA